MIVVILAYTVISIIPPLLLADAGIMNHTANLRQISHITKSHFLLLLLHIIYSKESNNSSCLYTTFVEFFIT
ncbi:MAG: hypothetical protein K2J29_04765, partial [Muribaculaceae bacterium]|nr:hypothetical protein [Muribaculaceae bacterium]